MDNLDAIIQQSTQLLTLASILGGFAFTTAVTIFLSKDLQKKTLLTGLIFGIAALFFILALFSFVLIIGAGADLKLLTQANPEAERTLEKIGAAASLLTVIGLYLLFAGTAFAGWLHSKLTGTIMTTFVVLAAIGSVCIIVSMFSIYF